MWLAESTVITLSDWYHAAATTLTFPCVSHFTFARICSVADTILVTRTFDTTLINGLGRFGGAGGSDSNLTVITVEQGKR